MNRDYRTRFNSYYDELKWLYCELYENSIPEFTSLCEGLERYYDERSQQLRQADQERLEKPQWYKNNQMLGMMMYTDNFAEDLNGISANLDYIKACGVNYLHLMPLMESPDGRDDGGYAVADFRRVKPKLGTIDDLEKLAGKCRKQGISICLDFVMNHTSEDHEWAIRAKNGEREYQNRYYFYDNFDIPSQFEKTVPQVFPTTAPGNFTYNPETGKFVMTTFYPYQWDLNYRNPIVLNEMIFNLLFLVNKGIDIIRIDAVPYIWKQLGTNCRNLPQVHNIVRILRIICEIVCPGVLLLGEVVMEPDKVVPYFGSAEKPECHMLYNVTTMAATWHTVATKDVRLLKRQMDIVNALPKEYVFLNYLRCHDDIGWGLDYRYLRQFGIEEIPHKKFLNDFFSGQYPYSFARGELYNAEPQSGDARICGTTASLCGIEKAAYERKEYELKCAIRYHLTLHAYMLSQSGIPMIYSGDELAQENDYTYHKDARRCADSRYLHRGKFDWKAAGKRNIVKSTENEVYWRLQRLIRVRKEFSVFDSDAFVRTVETYDNSVLGIIREKNYEKLVCLYNFSDRDKTAWINETDGQYINLITNNCCEAKAVGIPAFGFAWLMRN